MRSEWPDVEIGDVCAVGDGAHSKVARQLSGIRYLTSKNIGRGSLKLENVDYISKDDFDRLFPVMSKATRRPIAGDVLIGIIGTFGNAYLYKKSDDFGFSSSIGILRPNRDKLTPEYLYYVITSQQFQSTHANHNAGTAQGYTNIPTVKKIAIPLPPIDSQRRIAEILTALDDRITLLRETNSTLDAIAQALFKSWFVDFDPVRAKREGRVPEGMDEATARLFPYSFEESQLGLVPRGWRVGTLGSILKLRNERVQPSEHTVSLPYVPIENISSKVPFLQEFKSGEYANSSLALFKKGDVLFGAMRPYFHKVCAAPFDGVTRTTVFTLTPVNAEASAFALFQAYQDSTIDYATQHSEGSTIPYAKWRNSMELMPLLLPPEAVQTAFSAVVSALVEQGNSNVLEAQTLATLRDTLLPRLISGQLRIPDMAEASQN
jgi:type I restriction enzyme, S subunit